MGLKRNDWPKIKVGGENGMKREIFLGERGWK